MSFERKVGKV